MAKPQSQAAESSGYEPTSIPGVIRLGNQYRKDPNYPPPAPARKPAELILKPIPKGYAKGGEVKGPGTATSDSIPAKLSKGEVVIPAAVVKHFGLGTFKKMIAAVPPQLGAKTTVKDGVVHAAGSNIPGTRGYVDPKKKPLPDLEMPSKENAIKSRIMQTTGVNPPAYGSSVPLPETAISKGLVPTGLGTVPPVKEPFITTGFNQPAAERAYVPNFTQPEYDGGIQRGKGLALIEGETMHMRPPAGRMGPQPERVLKPTSTNMEFMANSTAGNPSVDFTNLKNTPKPNVWSEQPTQPGTVGKNIKTGLKALVTDPVNAGMAADTVNEILLNRSAQQGNPLNIKGNVLGGNPFTWSAAGRGAQEIAKSITGGIDPNSPAAKIGAWANKPLPFFNKQPAEQPSETTLSDLVTGGKPTPTTKPQRQATSVNKPAIPETQAGPAGNNGNNGNTQTGQAAATTQEVAGKGYAPATITQGQNSTQFRTAPTEANPNGGLGSVQWKDNRKLSNESQDYLGGVLAREADPGFQQRLKEQAKIVDDRYAWAANKEKEYQQQGQQDQLNNQIQQAIATLQSPDYGGKKEAMAFLDYAGRLQGQQSANQKDANQFGQEMDYKREQGAALGATEAAKMKQQKDIEQAKLDANKFATRGGGIDPSTGQAAPGIVYSTKTGLDVGNGDTSNQITPESAKAIQDMHSTDTSKQKLGSGYLQKHYPEIYKMFQQG